MRRSIQMSGEKMELSGNLATNAFAALNAASGAGGGAGLDAVAANLPPGISREFLQPSFDLLMDPKALHLPDDAPRKGPSLAQTMKNSVQAAQNPSGSAAAPSPPSISQIPSIANAGSKLAQIAMNGDYSGASLMSGVNALAALAGPSGNEIAAILSRAQQIGAALGVDSKDILNLFDGETGALGEILSGDFSKVTGAFDEVMSGDFSKMSGALDGLEGFAMGQLSPQAQAAVSVAKQALQALGLPSDLKSAVAKANASPKSAPPGVYVEGHQVATLVLSGTVHGVPLQPGPGALTVLANGQPVWRTVTDKHLCPMGPPPHGLGAVAKGAVQTYAEKFLIARHEDMVIEPGAGPVQIVPMPIAAKIAEARDKVAADKAKQEKVAKDKAAADKAKQDKAAKEKASTDTSKDKAANGAGKDKVQSGANGKLREIPDDHGASLFTYDPDSGLWVGYDKDGQPVYQDPATNKYYSLGEEPKSEIPLVEIKDPRLIKLIEDLREIAKAGGENAAIGAAYGLIIGPEGILIGGGGGFISGAAAKAVEIMLKNEFGADPEKTAAIISASQVLLSAGKAGYDAGSKAFREAENVLREINQKYGDGLREALQKEGWSLKEAIEASKNKGISNVEFAVAAIKAAMAGGAKGAVEKANEEIVKDAAKPSNFDDKKEKN